MITGYSVATPVSPRTAERKAKGENPGMAARRGEGGTVEHAHNSTHMGGQRVTAGSWGPLEPSDDGGEWDAYFAWCEDNGYQAEGYEEPGDPRPVKLLDDWREDQDAASEPDYSQYEASKLAWKNDECYGCGYKGEDGWNGAGWDLQCPKCGSYEVHDKDAGKNWGKTAADTYTETCAVCGCPLTGNDADGWKDAEGQTGIPGGHLHMILWGPDNNFGGDYGRQVSAADIPGPWENDPSEFRAPLEQITYYAHYTAPGRDWYIHWYNPDNDLAGVYDTGGGPLDKIAFTTLADITAAGGVKDEAFVPKKMGEIMPGVTSSKTASMGLASMKTGEQRVLSSEGIYFTISYYGRQASGDDGNPAQGYTTGEFTVYRSGSDAGPDITGSRREFSHSPDGPTLDRAKAYAAEQAEQYMMDAWRKAKMDRLYNQASRTADLAPSAVTATCVNCGKTIGKSRAASGADLWVAEGNGGVNCVNANASISGGHRPDKISSRRTAAAQAPGYYVVSRNGSAVAGPFATISDAAPDLIKNRGAAIEYKSGLPLDPDWAATKGKPFPYGTNTVNGSRKVVAHDVKVGEPDPGVFVAYCLDTGCGWSSPPGSEDGVRQAADTHRDGDELQREQGAASGAAAPMLDKVTTASWNDSIWDEPHHTASRKTATDSKGDWECYGCGARMQSLSKGWNTTCPKCGSYEIHLTDSAKKSAEREPGKDDWGNEDPSPETQRRWKEDEDREYGFNGYDEGYEASRRTAGDVNYGGGPGSDDPGIEFNYVDAGHKAVYNGLGTDGTCEVCGGPVLFDGFGPGDHLDPNTETLWQHVEREKTAAGSWQDRYAIARHVAGLRHFS